MAFFGNKRKDFSIQPPRQQVDGTPFFVTDSANIDFTLENLNLTANLTQLLSISGTYGSPTLIPILDIDEFGRITGVSTTEFSASGIALKTNDTDNDSQTILNLTDSETIEVVDEGDGVIKFNYVGDSSTYTASQGLKLVLNDIQLGSDTDNGSASITNTRYINIDSTHALKIKGELNHPYGEGILSVNNTYSEAGIAQPTAISGTSLGVGIYGGSTGSYPFSIGLYGYQNGGSGGYGIYGESATGYGIKAFSNRNTAIILQRSADVSEISSVVEMGYYLRQTDEGLGTAGVGMQFTYDINSTAGGLSAHQIIHKWTNATPGSQLSQYEIWGNRYGTLEQHFTLKGTGQLQLNKYGKATKAFPGTTKWFLTTDDQGNVIEVDAPTGTGDVSGSGTATRVAIWTGTTAIGDDSLFYWDNTNKALAIGAASSPSAAARLYLFSSTNNADVFIESIYNQRLKFKNTNSSTQWHTSTNVFEDTPGNYRDSYNIGQSSNPANNYLEILKSGRVKIGTGITGGLSFSDTIMLELGLDGTRAGQMLLNASTSGNITLKAKDTTTPYTLTLPDKPSAADLFLKTDASGNTSWATGSTGTGTVQSITAGTGLEATASNPITVTGTIQLNSKLSPADTLTGNAGKFLRVKTDESAVEYATVTSGGGGGGRSYYLNGSVVQGDFAGILDMREMSPVPVIGAGTDFPINTNGYIASFITDAGDPNKLVIPAGNWNFELWFNVNNPGGSPNFYVELSKYDGATFTPISTSSVNPTNITSTSITLYLTALSVPQTPLALTDRLAVRVFVNHGGGSRLVKLHTQGPHLSQIITDFPSGIVSLNGLTEFAQNFATPGTTGLAPNWVSSSDTHTLNIPLASAADVTAGLVKKLDFDNFNTAYNDRLKWDGGATDLVAATGRTSLGLGTFATANYPTWASGTPFVKMTAAGTFSLDTATYLTTAVTSVSGTGTTAGLSLTGTVTTTGNITLGGTLSTPVSTINDSTTVGQNFVKLTNPSAITFPRINADNTVSALNAADFRTAIGAGGGGGITQLNTDVNTLVSSGPTAATLATPLKTGSFGITVDGVTTIVQVGQLGYVTIPYGGTIEGWTITANASGNIQFDIWRATGAIPTIGSSIIAANYPTLSGTNYAVSSTLAGWTPGFVAGSVFGFHIIGTPTVIKNATLTLRCTKLPS